VRLPFVRCYSTQASAEPSIDKHAASQDAAVAVPARAGPLKEQACLAKTADLEESWFRVSFALIPIARRREGAAHAGLECRS
jgi:hypothetical protein